MYYSWSIALSYFFFFNDPATTEIYTYGHTLSLHDALPIFPCWSAIRAWSGPRLAVERIAREFADAAQRADQLRRLDRSEEHTSELQSLMRISYAVFCLKKKIN